MNVRPCGSEFACPLNLPIIWHNFILHCYQALYLSLRFVCLTCYNYLIIFQNDSELFGRTVRVNIAAPQRIKEGSTRPVWSDDNWLQKHAGETLQLNKENAEDGESKDTTKTGSSVSGFAIYTLFSLSIGSSVRLYLHGAHKWDLG